MPDGGAVLARVLPGRDVAEARVVALGLAFRGLVLLAEMAAARLLALERVAREQLAELEVIGHPARVLEALVEVVGRARHAYLVPELLAEPRDPLERLAEARGAA